MVLKHRASRLGGASHPPEWGREKVGKEKKGERKKKKRKKKQDKKKKKRKKKKRRKTFFVCLSILT